MKWTTKLPDREGLWKLRTSTKYAALEEEEIRIFEWHRGLFVHLPERGLLHIESFVKEADEDVRFEFSDQPIPEPEEAT